MTNHSSHGAGHTGHATALQRVAIPLSGLDCVCCAEELEARVKKLPHVASARVDFQAERLTVEFHAGMTTEEEVRRAVDASGRCFCDDGAAAPAASHTAHLQHVAQMAPVMGTKHDRMQYEMPSLQAHADHETHHAEASSHAGMEHDMSDPRVAKAMERDMRNRFLVSLLLTVPTVLYSPLGKDFFGVDLPTGPLNNNWLLLIVSTPVVSWGGWVFLAGAVRSLRHRALNMSVLIATGVVAAYAFSVVITVGDLGETFFEAAAMLVTFVLFGHWMEMKARRGTTDALRALFDLVPPRATVLRDGAEVDVPTSDIVAGDVVVLRPGDKVPVDGVIEWGETSIDESLVTGESLPVDKAPGDQVVGGSINISGSVRFRATKVGAETALAQIVRLVEQAQNSKAPGQRLADRAASYLVVLAVGSGLVTFLVWQFLIGESTLQALTFAISAVVIACPDALGLATPTAVTVGTGLGARHNILFKDASTLEGAARISAVVLDKTGTLTEGSPRLAGVAAVDVSEDELLSLTASAESGSGHPLAQAIVQGARGRGVALGEPSAFESVTGKGIRAVVRGRLVVVGNRRFLEEQSIQVEQLAESAAGEAQAGRTPMFVAVDGRAAGLVSVADTVKPSARLAVRRLREIGIEVVMITGDNERTAAAVAKELGIERAFAEVLPEDKARYVRQLQEEGHFVAMVGDGVNDAPALAQADIGIAIGAGTDVAIETARVVLMKSDPLDVVRAIRLSKATVRKMKQNLFWASVYNVLAIPVAAGVLYRPLGIELRPEWSALLMSLSSIIVATNAVLLKCSERDIVAG
ncbi:MAG TPA: heavy metal translocating P-type ATPase [Dehalococcoidia bacterium]|nr:heavy metal translocating P-type ATPase [Dehalococcoidia bacterium]